MDLFTLDTTSASPESADQDSLSAYAQRAYLEYALSVVKGRALPDACDGQKPVQRRILFSMSRMGLGFGGVNGASGAKPVKSARVVGDVLGKYHPHGDSAAYDAMVRMAQDFSQRYPLVDGQGNFGSRDGDSAAAMRYTEARLARITSLLLDELDEGTVDFIPNYDGSFEEPRQLPARLPFTLLNGASGIAVGLATEIPSHNLREVADACIALIKTPKLADAELYNIIAGPDYPGGGQIISSAADIAAAYTTGRGSLKVRARWKIEDLARGPGRPGVRVGHGPQQDVRHLGAKDVHVAQGGLDRAGQVLAIGLGRGLHPGRAIRGRGHAAAHRKCGGAGEEDGQAHRRSLGAPCGASVAGCAAGRSPLPNATPWGPVAQR